MTDLNGKNLIGKTQSSKGRNTFRAVNPANLEPLDTTFTEASPDEINDAVEKAEAAFRLSRNISYESRAKFLEAIAEEILGVGDLLIQRCMQETALPEARLTGERMRTVNQLRLFASVVREGSWVGARIDTAIPDRQPQAKPDIRQMQIPLGPVGIFGASNFPLAFSVAGGDTVSALAAGCPVVFKAHPLHPGTSELVGKAMLAAAESTGMPDGIFSLVQGASVDVGMNIVRHLKITAIGFTGSFKGGKAIFDAANQRAIPIPVFAEMGSVNPVFILPGALNTKAKEIAKGLAASFTLGVGQFCTNPGVVFTPKSHDSQGFLTTLEKSTRESGGGSMLSAGIKANFQKGAKYLESSNGVRLLASGLAEEKDNFVNSKVFTADATTFLNDDHLMEEVFGPSTLVVSTDGKKEMLDVAEAMGGHLTATIHGTEKDLTEYVELIRILVRKVGRIIFNGFPTGVEVCHSMVHGGPFPATTASQSTSVGTAAIFRFSRPVCYQDFPQGSLPDALKNDNPLSIWRLVNGQFTRNKIE